MVGAEPFIRNMKDGYQADVGEGGNRLSTGQKQLISFARCDSDESVYFRAGRSHVLG